MGFGNQNVRTWVGLFFETSYISGLYSQKWAFKVNIYDKFRLWRLKIARKWVEPQKFAYKGGLGHESEPIS